MQKSSILIKTIVTYLVITLTIGLIIGGANDSIGIWILLLPFIFLLPIGAIAIVGIHGFFEDRAKNQILREKRGAIGELVILNDLYKPEFEYSSSLINKTINAINIRQETDRYITAKMFELEKIINTNYNEVTRIIKFWKEGYPTYKDYLEEYEKIKTKYIIPENTIEYDVFKEQKIRPFFENNVHIKISNGNYSKETSYRFKELLDTYNWIIQAQKDKSNRKEWIAYQRSLMTDKLRWQVLSRDNHKCVVCGNTAKDGVKLHVDHKVSLANGGKTELDNLQTLCERCNMGKGTDNME